MFANFFFVVECDVTMEQHFRPSATEFIENERWRQSRKFAERHMRKGRIQGAVATLAFSAVAMYGWYRAMQDDLVASAQAAQNVGVRQDLKRIDLEAQLTDYRQKAETSEREVARYRVWQKELERALASERQKNETAERNLKEFNDFEAMLGTVEGRKKAMTYIQSLEPKEEIPDGNAE